MWVPGIRQVARLNKGLLLIEPISLDSMSLSVSRCEFTQEKPRTRVLLLHITGVFQEWPLAPGGTCMQFPESHPGCHVIEPQSRTLVLLVMHFFSFTVCRRWLPRRPQWSPTVPSSVLKALGRTALIDPL